MSTTAPGTLLALLGVVALAHAQPRVAVPDVRSVLVAAIDAPDGRAQGVLSGALAEAIARRFSAEARIHIDVSTVRRYAQRGCSRLNARIWQDGVLLPGGSGRRRQTIDIGISYCRDGAPPRWLD